MPVSYATLNCENEGFIIAVGQELSQLTALQQKLVSAQQTLERDYVQLRHVETVTDLYSIWLKHQFLFAKQSQLKF